LSAATT
jgi:hypothetical protein